MTRRTVEQARFASLPVLVIEHDEELCDRLYTVLEGAGYPVLCVDSDKSVESLFESLFSPSKMALAGISGIVAGARKFVPLNTDDFCGWLPRRFPHLASRVIFLQQPFDCERFLKGVREAIGQPPATERILLVDDEEAVREIMASMLSSVGYRCRHVPGGTQALKLLDSGQKFDLITSDICNPEMDGTLFLEQVMRKFPEVPVLMIHAVHGISVSLACIRNGAYDYLPKPFEREQLVLAVRRALEFSRLKRENRDLQAQLAAFQRDHMRRVNGA